MCVCGSNVKAAVKIAQQHVVIKKGSEAEQRQKLFLCPNIGAGICLNSRSKMMFRHSFTERVSLIWIFVPPCSCLYLYVCAYVCA